MRLLAINPNTSHDMTAKVARAAEAVLGNGFKVDAVSGRFGPRYIASRAAYAIAGHAALDAYAAHGAGADVVLLACFGDPGLDAIREVAPAPVIGLVEASAREAGAGGRRYAIVTGGVLWESMLRETLEQKRLDGGLCVIRTVAPDGGMIARDPEGALKVLGEACDSCAREFGAEAVILGGVGLIGLAERLQQGRAYPIICSVMAGLRAVAAAAVASAKFSPPDVRPVDSIGLSPELAALLHQTN
ncbi:MAG: Asp/Glu racemase [Betaproteobacteria bacterium]|nr:Asp/Glu racemase [Betaproteobacteria bacterium]